MSEKKYLDYDGLTRFSNKILKLISGVENGSTASKQYLAGQYFIRSGDLKVATQTINQGGSFSASNCTSTDIGGELSDLNGSVDSIIAMISGVEDSTTASKAYTAGEFLIYNGKLYEVTADIASGGTIVLTGASQNVSESNVGGELAELKGAITSVEGDFATIENGTTSSAAYTPGNFIFRNGKLYQVIQSIAQGGTFTVGTNIIATTVGAHLVASRPTRVYCGKFTTDNVTQDFAINRPSSAWIPLAIEINSNIFLMSSNITEMVLLSGGAFRVTRTGTGVWAGNDVYVWLKSY